MQGSSIPNQGLNPHLLWWKWGILTTGPPVKSLDSRVERATVIWAPLILIPSQTPFQRTLSRAPQGSDTADLTALPQLSMILLLQLRHSENPRMEGAGRPSPGASMWPPPHLVLPCWSAWFSSPSLPWSFSSSSWEAWPGLCFPSSSQPLSRWSNFDHTLIIHCTGSQSQLNGPPGMTIPWIKILGSATRFTQPRPSPRRSEHIMF